MLHGCSLIAEFEDDVERMRVRGEALYEDTCASCHGANGEGHAQLDAPALDHSEHAWHHADEQIVHIIRNGGFQMPPVGADLSDSDMESLIAYFKGWWTEEQREIQRGSTGE
jgi:mono/diheme cytochrome c family protein